MSKLKEATPNISKPNIKLGPWNCEIARNMFLRFSELTNYMSWNTTTTMHLFHDITCHVKGGFTPTLHCQKLTKFMIEISLTLQKYTNQTLLCILTMFTTGGKLLFYVMAMYNNFLNIPCITEITPLYKRCEISWAINHINTAAVCVMDLKVATWCPVSRWENRFLL